MKDTKIRWAHSTWNPMTGCSRVSPGCDNCYAETLAERFRGGAAFPNGFEPQFKAKKLNDPKNWSPRVIFVNSLSDVHHEAFSRDEVDAVYDRMCEWNWHDYLVLTKRPRRMQKYLDSYLDRSGLSELPDHIWVGTSIETQKYAWRSDVLAEIPAKVHFASVEPMLGPVHLKFGPKRAHLIDWVIVGGESGPGFRDMDPAWAKDVRDDCAKAGVAFFFKQQANRYTEREQLLGGRRYEAYPQSRLWRDHVSELHRPLPAPRTRVA